MVPEGQQYFDEHLHSSIDSDSNEHDSSVAPGAKSWLVDDDIEVDEDVGQKGVPEDPL